MNYHNIRRTNKLPRSCLPHIVQEALKEDIAKKDITTDLTVAKDKFIKAVLLAKEDCVVCGLEVVSCVFRKIDKNIKFKPLILEGRSLKEGEIIARLWGRAQSILRAERVALNFLSLLSGIATQTKKYVDKVRPYRVKIMDTRKTIPGLRELQKYAVRAGGGFNHRMRLDEMVLVKDNHLAASCVVRRASCVKEIIETIKKKKPKDVKIEIEVKNLREFKEALKAEPDIIMLDNMNLSDIRKAIKIKRNTQYASFDNAQDASRAALRLVSLAQGRPERSRGTKSRDAIRHTLIEASGGITLEKVKKIASAGVDMISVGGLTHSLKSVDISLEVL